MVHQDSFNLGCNWVISVEKYKGGRIWVEDADGTEPPFVKHASRLCSLRHRGSVLLQMNTGKR
eukprot:3979041-Amphidinium_carterae.1